MSKAHYQTVSAKALVTYADNEPDGEYSRKVHIHAKQLLVRAGENQVEAESIADLSEKAIPQCTKDVQAMNGLKSLSPAKRTRNGGWENERYLKHSSTAKLCFDAKKRK